MGRSEIQGLHSRWSQSGPHENLSLKKAGKEGPLQVGAAKAAYSAASVDSASHTHNRKESYSGGPGFQSNESDDPDRDKGAM